VIPIRATIERAFHDQSAIVRAALYGATRDFALAEDALQDAFIAALEQWPGAGVPDDPVAWLATVGRRRAIDRLRRRAVRDAKAVDLEAIARLEEGARDEGPVADDRLRLLFTCCHPALAIEAQVALTLRTVAGLTTPEIARAFLVSEATLAQRLVRAQKKIKDAGIPYAVPEASELPERLEAVLRVVYLVFNEAYRSTTPGTPLVRTELAQEAIRLARVLTTLVPDEPEVEGLLALLLLLDARRSTRVADGVLVPLEEQDRERWDRERITEGIAVVERAFRRGEIGFYLAQAAIAAEHARAARASETRWDRIVQLYDVLAALQPSPVIALNRAAALAMAQGPAAGLALLDGLAPELERYQPFHAARADLLRRSGDHPAAARAYEDALALTDNDAERAFLHRRLEEVRG
jgi:RNA polymerase sigma-70 factor (ECF subfamily)